MNERFSTNFEEEPLIHRLSKPTSTISTVRTLDVDIRTSENPINIETYNILLTKRNHSLLDDTSLLNTTIF